MDDSAICCSEVPMKTELKLKRFSFKHLTAITKCAIYRRLKKELRSVFLILNSSAKRMNNSYTIKNKGKKHEKQTIQHVYFLTSGCYSSVGPTYNLKLV